MTFTELGSGNSRSLSCAFIVHSRCEMWLKQCCTLNPEAFDVIQNESAISDGLQPSTRPNKAAKAKQVHSREIAGLFASRLGKPAKHALGSMIAEQSCERRGPRGQHPHRGARAAAHGEPDESAEPRGACQPAHHTCLHPSRSQLAHPIEQRCLLKEE